MTGASVVARTTGVTVDIVLSGEIDLSNSDAVRDEIFAAVGNHLTAVRLDVGGVTYIDSTGMRILFALAERLRLLQTECIMIAPMGAPARRLIELSGLASVVDLRG